MKEGLVGRCSHTWENPGEGRLGLHGRGIELGV